MLTDNLTVHYIGYKAIHLDYQTFFSLSDPCHKCGEYGHFRVQCPLRRTDSSNQENANSVVDNFYFQAPLENMRFN